MMSLYQKYVGDLIAYATGEAQFGFVEASLTGPAYPVELDFALEREDRYYSPKDADGIPIRVYRSVGAQYNPTRIASFALAHFNRWIARKHDQNLASFLNAADWFLKAENAQWTYDYDWNDLRAPWLSCMAQGQGISVLTRAYAITGDASYAEHARRAAVPFTRPIAAGGVRSRLEDGSAFLEEYPSPRSAHVLNGFLFALMGINELARIDSTIRDEIGEAELLRALCTNIERWDAGFWSVYDLSPGPWGVRNLTTLSYHQLHITQLRYLGAAYKCGKLVDVADRWQRHAQSARRRLRAMAGKVKYRLLVSTQR